MKNKKYLIGWKDESYGRYVQLWKTARTSKTLIRHAKTSGTDLNFVIVHGDTMTGRRAKHLVKYTMYLAEHGLTHRLRKLCREEIAIHCEKIESDCTCDVIIPHTCLVHGWDEKNE